MLGGVMGRSKDAYPGAGVNPEQNEHHSCSHAMHIIDL